jgi:UDP:flavonoid glycosyltransferase YjiC (YdhE family)
MKITILTLGSRGDVQPFIALGASLNNAGHSVRIATSKNFKQFTNDHGLEFGAIALDIRQILDSYEGREIMQSGGNIIRTMSRIKSIMETSKPILERTIEDIWLSCQGSDRIVIGGLLFPFGEYISQLYPVPVFLSSHTPRTLTANFQHPWFPNYPHSFPFGKRLYHRMSFQLADYLVMRMITPTFNHFLKLRFGNHLKVKTQNNKHPILYCYSPCVIPNPPEWSSNVQVIGYWYFRNDSQWQPSTELDEFLKSDPKPIYIGFGSMSSSDTDRMSEIVMQALKISGQRGILLRGWGGLQKRNLSNKVIFVDEVPHDWLFPRVSLVVHHGGAGTTGAALRAGVPSIIVPHFADQPFWSQRIYELGCSSRPIPLKHLTSPKLANAIKTTLNDPMIKQRTLCISKKIQAENGIDRAIKVITNDDIGKFP